ncbi:MAG: hypothetical protein WCH11_00660 [Bdellovibrio sp.]
MRAQLVFLPLFVIFMQFVFNSAGFAQANPGSVNQIDDPRPEMKIPTDQNHQFSLGTSNKHNPGGVLNNEGTEGTVAVCEICGTKTPHASAAAIRAQTIPLRNSTDKAGQTQKGTD